METLQSMWDVLDTSHLPAVPTLANATEYVIGQYGLPIGEYTVRLNASLYSSKLDLSYKTVISETHIKIKKGFLMAGIDGNSYVDAPFNTTLLFSSYDLTYFADRPVSDKTGMEYEWRCKRATEDWPTESPMPAQPYAPHSGGNGGCFGTEGPGVLDFAVGSWNLTFNTGYLEPQIEYHIQFWAKLDFSTATADVTVFVQQPNPPNITLR